ncbi:hypothetical protein [Flavonifractor sp. An100]|uniref:hypothetical protein n=1 Tax=Flavonifractor sp. An100 TaxID=1965538 RepID=UPI000B377A86|nr:hypothetical protein [Flavonifractor sp. An100]OUQ81649.1 hypothetical protein B5E43_01840 [Flavonifractor sp. An100]
MGKKETFSPPVVGGSSLLVIFAVLCLTIFALLALSGVQANQRLADAAVQAVSDYYQADCQAEQILAQLRQGERPQGVQEQNGIYTYSCPISDTQALEVAVELDGISYQILRWQAVSTAEWQPDDDLAVWDGE